MNMENTNENTNAVSNSAAPAEKKAPKLHKHRILSHPILGGILLIIYGFFFYQICGEFGGNSAELSSLLSALGGVLLLVIHRLWFRGEYKGCISFDCFRNSDILKAVGIFFLADIICYIPGVIRLGFVAPSFHTFSSSLMAAIGEETVFRVLPISIMMRAYKDKDKYMPALILSSVVFGCVHFLNMTAGADLPNTLVQVFSAIATGFLLGAIYLRTGSIVIPMLIHFLHDLLSETLPTQATGVISGTFTINDVVENGVLLVVEIVLVVFLLKGHKEDIIAVWKNIWAKPEEAPAAEAVAQKAE